MRDLITIKLRGRDYSLLPSFAVLSNFEDRHGSIATHYSGLVGLTATLAARSWLVLQALQAFRSDAPSEGRSFGFTQDVVAESIFEAGLWHDQTVQVEINLVEALLYTPEQYQAKKAERAAAAVAQTDVMDSMAALASFSASLPST